MKIEKLIWNNGDYYHYYKDSKTKATITHGLISYFYSIIGYYYHDERKGFWLNK